MTHEEKCVEGTKDKERRRVEEDEEEPSAETAEKNHPVQATGRASAHEHTGCHGGNGSDNVGPRQITSGRDPHGRAGTGGDIKT